MPRLARAVDQTGQTLDDSDFLRQVTAGLEPLEDSAVKLAMCGEKHGAEEFKVGDKVQHALDGSTGTVVRMGTEQGGQDYVTVHLDSGQVLDAHKGDLAKVAALPKIAADDFKPGDVVVDEDDRKGKVKDYPHQDQSGIEVVRVFFEDYSEEQYPTGLLQLVKAAALEQVASDGAHIYTGIATGLGVELADGEQGGQQPSGWQPSTGEVWVENATQTPYKVLGVQGADVLVDADGKQMTIPVAAFRNAVNWGQFSKGASLQKQAEFKVGDKVKSRSGEAGSWFSGTATVVEVKPSSTFTPSPVVIQHENGDTEEALSQYLEKVGSFQRQAQAVPLVVGDRIRVDYLGSVLKGTVVNVSQIGPESLQQLQVKFDHAPNDMVELHSDQVRKVTASTTRA